MVEAESPAQNDKFTKMWLKTRERVAKFVKNQITPMLNIQLFTCNPFQEHAAVAWDEAGAGVIVDPGFYDDAEIEAFTGFVKEKGIRPEAIFLTHCHPDHVFGVAELCREYGVKVYMSPEDKEMPQYAGAICRLAGMHQPDMDFTAEDIADGDRIKVGTAEYEVIATPGHTPGSVCFYNRGDKVLFSGDTLFAGSIGRTDLPGGDYDKLIVSVMDKVMGLDGDVMVLPGHGPKTDIAHERTHNPFLQPFNEPDDDYGTE